VRDAGCQPADARQLFTAHKLALRIEQAFGHSVQTLGKGREVPGIGAGGAGSQVAICHRIRCLHHAVQRPQDQAADQPPAVEHEDRDLDSDEDDDEENATLGRHGQRQQRGRDADQKSKSNKKCQVEQQLDAERRLWAAPL
jgi:hypothetical protein